MNLQSQWILGQTDGEGCFHSGINKNPEMRCGYQILPEFTMTQHKKDIKVLYALKAYFGCGVVRVNYDDRYCYRVRQFSHLKEIIVPFFEKHKLVILKRLEFEKCRRVFLLMEQKQHLTLEGIEKIQEIQETLNRKKHQNGYQAKNSRQSPAFNEN